MEFIDRIFQDAFSQTLVSIAHNWPFLAASILVAAITKVFADADKVAALLRRFRGAGVFAATGAAVATPFCSCGTTAVILGLPLYLSSEASLPLVRALLDSGMSQGAIMAFLIAGSGTSIGAITGALTIARWKVVGLVVAVLWVGAILAGYGFDLFVAAGLA